MGKKKYSLFQSKVNGLYIQLFAYLDEALSALAVGDGSGGLLASEDLDRLLGILSISHFLLKWVDID